MSTIEIIWSLEQGARVAIIDGRIDSSNVSNFESQLKSGIKPDDKAFMMDFRHVPFMSSAGLRVVLQHANAFAPPKSFSVYGLSKSMKEIFEISGLNQVVNIYPTKEHALAAFLLETKRSSE